MVLMENLIKCVIYFDQSRVIFWFISQWLEKDQLTVFVGFFLLFIILICQGVFCVAWLMSLMAGGASHGGTLGSTVNGYF